MPNASPITLTAAGGDIILSPDSVTGTHVVYQDLTGEVLSRRALLHFDRPSAEKTTLRRTIRLNVPLTRVVDGVEQQKSCTARVEFIFPADSTKVERANLRNLIHSAIATAAVEAVVDNPEWVW